MSDLFQWNNRTAFSHLGVPMPDGFYEHKTTEWLIDRLDCVYQRLEYDLSIEMLQPLRELADKIENELDRRAIAAERDGHEQAGTNQD